MRRFKGIWGASYELPDKTALVQTDVKVTKKDGKVFYIPVADILDIASIYHLENQIDQINAQIKKLART